MNMPRTAARQDFFPPDFDDCRLEVGAGFAALGFPRRSSSRAEPFLDCLDWGRGLMSSACMEKVSHDIYIKDSVYIYIVYIVYERNESSGCLKISYLDKYCKRRLLLKLFSSKTFHSVRHGAQILAFIGKYT